MPKSEFERSTHHKLTLVTTITPLWFRRSTRRSSMPLPPEITFLQCSLLLAVLCHLTSLINIKSSCGRITIWYRNCWKVRIRKYAIETKLDSWRKIKQTETVIKPISPYKTFPSPSGKAHLSKPLAQLAQKKCSRLKKILKYCWKVPWSSSSTLAQVWRPISISLTIDFVGC